METPLEERAPETSTSVLRTCGLTKHYGAAIALAGVDFNVQAHEIHALLGENGAGKSTLIKTLAGLIKPDYGEILIADQSWSNGLTQQDAAASGLRFVHQDLALVDSLSVADNIALETGYAMGRWGLIDHKATIAQVRDRLAVLGSFLDPEKQVGDLSQAEKVIVAMARALREGTRVLVLDEVTASLPAPEAQRLHHVIRKTRDTGVSVIFVSHRIDEVLSLCDRATVLADGKHVACASLSDVDRSQIIRWIVGREPAQAARPTAPKNTASPRVAVKGLWGPGIGNPLDFSVMPGEIVGITGLVGSGYEAVARWLAGLDQPSGGSLGLSGVELPFGRPHVLRTAGFQAISGHRSDSAFPTLSVRENMFPTRMAGRAGSLDAERKRATQQAQRYGVRPSGSSELPLSALSGGNQQKVLFARALDAEPQALLMLDPTAGVDIGAREELYALLRRETGRGLAVVLASSDFEEIECLADRALVLAQGRLAAVLEHGDIDQARLVYEALGATHAHDHKETQQ